MSLWRITSSSFIAGFILHEDSSLVIKTAPILRHAILGVNLDTVQKLCYRRGWKLEKLYSHQFSDEEKK